MRPLDRAPATAALRTLALALLTGTAAVVGFILNDRRARDIHERAAVLLGHSFSDVAAAFASMVTSHAVETPLRIA